MKLLRAKTLRIWSRWRKRLLKWWKPSKDWRALTSLRMEPLESRKLFSVAPWLPRPLDPVEGASGGTRDLSWFAYDWQNDPLARQYSELEVEIDLSGSFVLDVDGSYDFQLHIEGGKFWGTSSAVTFVFDEWGTVDFGLYQGGDSINGALSLQSFLLSQSVSASWQFESSAWGGGVLSSDSGTDGFNLVEDSTSYSDPVHWFGFNWYGFTNHVSDLNDLDLQDYDWTTFSVDSGGTFLFTFDDSGDETRDVEATRTTNPAPGIASEESYSVLENGTYAYQESGAGSFALYEEGSLGTALALTSVTYDEWATDIDFEFHRSGERTAESVGTATVDLEIVRTGESTTRLSNVSYVEESQSSYAYDEQGTACYTFHEEGVYTGGSFGLSVDYDREGSASFSYAEDGNTSFSSTGNETLLLVNASTFSHQSGLSGGQGGTSESNEITQTQGESSFSYRTSGTADYELHQEGEAIGGDVSLSSYALSKAISSTFLYDSQGYQANTGDGTRHRTETGNQCLSYAELAESEDSNQSYTAETRETYTFDGFSTFSNHQAGNSSYSSYEGGVYAGGSYSLTSVLYRDEGSATFAANETSTRSDSGDSTSTITLRADRSAMYGYGSQHLGGHSSFSSQETGTFQESWTNNSSRSGLKTYSYREAGSYAGGGFDLPSVVYEGSSTGTFAEGAVRTRKFNGDGTSHESTASDFNEAFDDDYGGTDRCPLDSR